MTPAELTAGRVALGLRPVDLGRILELSGRDPGRYVREWEKGAHSVPGPVAVAVRLMVEAQARQSLQEAIQQAQAIIAPPDRVKPVLEHLEAFTQGHKTRRRG
jgi:hypothetical protein